MNPRANRTDIIVMDKLTKKFGNLTAVQSIDLAVPSGEIFAFLGPNGAGKTTTIKMLTTLLLPTSGSIRIAGCDPAVDPHGVRSAFGIVFQDPSLDDELTAFENMEFHAVLYRVPRRERAPRIAKLLDFVELSTRAHDQVKTFSGGMKRRLEIARGLIHHPRILFMDEPTLGLDPQTRNRIWQYIQGMSGEEGTTVFFTTHYMEEAERVAGTVAIIDHGRIIATGSPADLQARAKVSTLEEVFLSVTGRGIREEEMTGMDQMRMRYRLWRK